MARVGRVHQGAAAPSVYAGVVAHDIRQFSVQLDGDYEQFWRVLEAIEAAAANVQHPENVSIDFWISVTHATGTYNRESVHEAQSVVERNGFELRRIWLYVMKKEWAKDGHDRASDPVIHDWIQVHSSRQLRGLDISVEHGSEVEVNGMFSMLQSAVTAALQLPEQKPDPLRSTIHPPRRTWWSRTWQAATTHPMAVTIVGGLIVVAIATWLGLG